MFSGGQTVTLGRVILDRGNVSTVVVTGDTETVVVLFPQPPLQGGGHGAGELEIIQVPPGVILWVFPVMVSLLQSPPERDKATEYDHDNDDDNHGDHGPGGLR